MVDMYWEVSLICCSGLFRKFSTTRSWIKTEVGTFFVDSASSNSSVLYYWNKAATAANGASHVDGSRGSKIWTGDAKKSGESTFTHWQYHNHDNRTFVAIVSGDLPWNKVVQSLTQNQAAWEPIGCMYLTQLRAITTIASSLCY